MNAKNPLSFRSVDVQSDSTKFKWAHDWRMRDETLYYFRWKQRKKFYWFYSNGSSLLFRILATKRAYASIFTTEPTVKLNKRSSQYVNLPVDSGSRTLQMQIYKQIKFLYLRFDQQTTVSVLRLISCKEFCCYHSYFILYLNQNLIRQHRE